MPRHNAICFPFTRSRLMFSTTAFAWRLAGGQPQTANLTYFMEDYE
jgi:hypothetical protein